jgi:gliding motility-associated-like protein
MKFILSLLILTTGIFVFGQTTNMPNNGSNSITGCAGTVRDPGGNQNYPNNTNSTLTICSGNANYILLTFSQFNMEQNYDFLTIYSGVGTGGTIIATLTGNALATNTYNAQSTCVTLVFTSDGSINASGFQLTYSCVPGSTCFDGIQNGTETGVDCGGCSTCPPCPVAPNPATVTATSNIYNLPCGGGNVNLNALGVATTPVLTSTFNAGSPGPGWTFTGSGMFTNPCGPSPSNTTHIWFGNASPHPRLLTTNGMDLSCGGTICFDLKFAIQSQTGSCEGPDLPNEGVTLSFSTDCGLTFQNIAYFHPNGTIIGANPGTTNPGINGATNFTTWGNYCFPIPPAAQSANTIIRWSQLATSGANFDHWGLDEVVISANNCNPYYYDWAHLPGSPNSPATTVNVLTTTTYNVIYTNGIDDTASASVTINVAGPTASTITTTPVDYCVGINSGSATFTGTGATPPNYTFQVTGPNGFTSTTTGSPSSTITNLAIGNYTLVTTETSSGCFTTLPFVITGGPFCCDVSVVPTNLTCNVANAPCNGSINSLPINGQGPYLYQWYTGTGTGSPIAGQTAQSINGQCAGTYTVQITDQSGCQDIATTTITQPTALTLSNTFTNILCNGANNGSITATAAGGTPGYTYSSGVTANGTGIFTPLSPGSYTITATDNVGCSATTSATIVQPPVLNYNVISVVQAFCGINNGSINVSATGGTGTYTYDIGGGVTNSNGAFNNLAPNTYTIIITDANGCSISTYPILVDAQTSPTLSVDSVSNETCFGSNSGYISVSVNGTFPNSAYNYSINGVSQVPGSTSEFPNLPAGSYNIVVTSPNGCADSAIVIITSPTLLSVSAVQTNVTCNGACDGTITSTITGGAAPYTYSLDGGFTFNNPPTTGLCAGNYALVVKDANGCLANQNLVITQPSQITYTATSTPGTCGFATGIYTFTSITGGTGGPYTISYDGSPFTSAFVYSLLPAGFDTIVIQDASGCQVTGLALINNIEAPFIVNTTVTNNLCFGGTTGSIESNTTVSLGGLPPPYNFSINGGPYVVGNINGGEDHLFSGLSNGQYVTIVQDANGCIALDTLTITSPTQLTLNYISTNLTCNGVNTGNIQFIGGGGTPFGSPTFGYLYSIDNGVTTNSTGVFTGLAAGTYFPYLEDANSCSITLPPIVITEPPLLTLAVVSSAPLCYNNCSGTIQLTGSGGVPGYVYSINNGTNYSANNNFTSVCSGTINYVVKDNNNCLANGSIVFPNPSQLTIATVPVNATCGLSNGTITANAAGGTGAYTYNINSGAYQGPNLFNGLGAGTYNISVQDANNCTAIATQAILQSGAPSITNIAITNPACNGGTGSITVTATGGTTAYSYSIDAGPLQGSSSFTGIAVGPHTVTVTDALGCTFTSPFTITQPTLLVMNAPVITPVLCNGASTGSITLNPTGGTLPYTYSFNGGVTFASANTLSSIPAGTYNVQVLDFNNCLVTANAIVAQPTPIVTAITQVNASCFGVCDGQIALNTSGGTGVLTYNWSSNIAPFNSGTATGVCAGTYDVIITDNNGCSITTPIITITQPPLVDIVSAVADSVLCFGQANGQITVIANNATTYSLTGPSGPLTNGSGVFTGLLAGYYNVTVSDAIGCQAQTNVFVYEPTVLTLNTTGDVDACTGIPVTFSGFGVGGTAPYTYSWSTGATTQSIDFTAATNTSLTVTVTDAYGCTAGPGIMNITLIPLIAMDPIADQYVCAGDSVFITATAQNGVPDYIFNWTHLDPTVDTNSAWLTGSNNPTSYWVIVKDLCIQYDSIEVLVYEYQAPTFDLTGPVDGCAPQTETFNIVNLSSPISNCTWDFGNTNTGVGCATVTETYTTPGLYTVLFTYEAYTGCPFDTTFTDVLEIFEVPIIDSINLTDPLCFGSADGTITVFGSLGNLPYDYQLDANPTQPTNLFNGLTDGTYTVTLSDLNSCFVDSIVTLIEPTELVITTVATVDVLCNGLSTGSINVTATGGTPPYLYSYDNGATFITADSLVSISAGTYNITVQDGNLCTVDSLGVVINEPTLFEFNVFTVANASCYNVCDGEIVVTTIGGVAPATFVWSANAAAGNVGTASNLCDGTYDLTVTDNNGCVIDSLLISVTEPPQIVITSLTVDSVICNGDNDGIIQITATNGDTYELSGPMPTVTNTTGTFNNLIPGTYTITIYDVNLCSIDTTVTIFEPTQLLITNVTVVNILCNGLSTGSISITASGGIPTYEYSFDNGATFGTSNSLGSLPAGTYNLIVRDVNLCTVDSLGVVITEPALFEFDFVTETNASCYNVCDGEINVGILGGVAPYTYTWSANAATGNSNQATALCDGLYNVTVTDGNLCVIDSMMISITEPPQIIITTLTVDSVTCFGLNDGAIQVTATNGDTYELSGPMPTVTNTTGTFAGLMPGAYTITIYDVNLCTIDTNITVFEPTQLTLTNSGDTTVCYATTVTHTATGGGGTLPYVYSWDTGATGNTLNYTALQDTALVVSITDANGCTIPAQTINITVIPLLNINPIANQTICIGDSVLTTAVAQDGLAPYVYTWSNITPGIGAQQYLHGTNNPNSYWVYVTDQCNDIDSTETLVFEYQAPTFNLTGPVDGCAPQLENFNITGATSPISNCSWDFDNGSTAIGCGPQTSNYTVPGLYSVVFSYEAFAGCQFDTTFTDVLEIFENPVIDSVVIENPLCFGSSDGVATVYASAGTPAYSYQLGAGPLQLNNDFSSLTSGFYSITLSDINSCVASSFVNLIDPPVLTINSIAVTDALCNGSADGSITVAALGGTAPYQYSFDGGTTYTSNPVATGLTAGTYHVFIRDTNLCTVDDANVIVGEPTPVVFTSVTVVDASCFGFTDGTITVVGSGGTPGPGYTYTWSANAATGNVAIAAGLGAGTYSVTITDDNNCNVDSLGIVVASPPQITITSIVTDSVSCFGLNDGSVTINATNAVLYSITPLSTGVATPTQAGSTFLGLIADSYTVQLTDANGCTFDSSFQIFEPTEILITSVVVTPNDCNGDNTGGITITASGGSGNYTYSFGGSPFGASNSNLTLAAGAYAASVQDANGCQADTFGVVITEPTALSIDLMDIVNATCFDECDGSITATVSGGVGPYSYTWSTSPNDSIAIINLCDGLYDLTVTDDNGCTIDTLNNAVVEPPQIVFNSITTDSVNCFGGIDGIIDITATNADTYIINGPVTVSQTNGNFTGLPAGFYTIELQDVNGCSVFSDTTLYEPNVIQLSTGNDTTVCANSPANLNAIVSGGTAPYLINWVGGAGFPAGPNQIATTATTQMYYVNGSDANGCGFGPDSTLVSVFDALTTTSLTDIIICQGATTTASVNVLTGVPTYTYNWSPAPVSGQGTSSAVLSNGNYSVTINDQCADEVIQNISVTNFAQPTLAFTGFSDGCAPHTVTLNPNNGTISNCTWNFGNGSTQAGCGPVSYTYQFGGVYSPTFTYTTADGCLFDTTISAAISVATVPNASFTFTPENPSLVYNTVQYTNTSTGGNSYSWNFDGLGTSNSQNPQFTFPINQVQDYNTCLTVTETFGSFSCSDTYCAVVPIQEEFSIFVPNAFTPDNDEHNNTFRAIILGEKANSFEMLIFDRWGELIFQSFDHTIGWDGTYNGRVCQDGVYIWKIRMKTKDVDDVVTKVGHVQLMR